MGSMVHLEINTPLFLDTAILLHTICIFHSSACIFLHSCPCMTSYLLIVLLVPCSWQCNEERGNPSRSLPPPSLQWSSGCEHPWQSREYECHALVAKQPQPRHKATRSTWRACPQRNSQRVLDLKLRKGLNQKLEIQPERQVQQPSCEKNKSPTGNRFSDIFESATLNLQRWTWADFWSQRQTAENIRHLSEEDCDKTCGMVRSQPSAEHFGCFLFDDFWGYDLLALQWLRPLSCNWDLVAPTWKSSINSRDSLSFLV